MWYTIAHPNPVVFIELVYQIRDRLTEMQLQKDLVMCGGCPCRSDCLVNQQLASGLADLNALFAVYNSELRRARYFDPTVEQLLNADVRSMQEKMRQNKV